MPYDSPEVCAHCGADVPQKALSCPECGADEETGLKTDYSSDLGLSDEGFDYDEFVEREFSSEKPTQIVPIGLHWFWWLIGIGLIIAMVLLWT